MTRTNKAHRQSTDEPVEKFAHVALRPFAGEVVLAGDSEDDGRARVSAAGLENAPVAKTNAFLQGPTNIINARVKLSGAFGSNADISAWGKNLTDQRRLAYALNVGRMRYGSFSEPMSYGLELGMKF